MARKGIRSMAVIGLLVMAGFAMVMPIEARLASCYDDWCDRQAVSNEAYYALTGTPYYYGSFPQYQLGMWNYLANDVSATKKLVEKLGGVGRYAGWSPDGVYKGYLDDGYWYDSTAGKKVGRGGQCLYFVNLILYRSGAVKYDKLPNNWNTVETNSGPVDWARTGDAIFIPRPKKYGDPVQHIAILAYRNGENVEVIESNKVRGSLSLVKPNGEMISIRYTTISQLRSENYYTYTGADYFWTT